MDRPEEYLGKIFQTRVNTTVWCVNQQFWKQIDGNSVGNLGTTRVVQLCILASSFVRMEE